MEEIKEEYVRLIGGIIYKARCKDTRSGIYIIPHQYIVNGDGKIEHQHIHSQYITKHSPRLMDLVEIGDIVNDYKILEIDNMSNPNKKAFTIFKHNEHSYIMMWSEEDIKTILTKEQYEVNCYKSEV